MFLIVQLLETLVAVDSSGSFITIEEEHCVIYVIVTMERKGWRRLGMVRWVQKRREKKGSGVLLSGESARTTDRTGKIIQLSSWSMNISLERTYSL